MIALAIIIVASLPWSYALITDPHGRSALLLIDFAALAGGLGFLVFGALKWSWLKTWWATHHLHACAVIANRVIFNRTRGPFVAVLSLLVFSQAREIKRLREWAGRAPERAAELEQRVTAQAASRLSQPRGMAQPIRRLPAQPAARAQPG